MGRSLIVLEEDQYEQLEKLAGCLREDQMAHFFGFSVNTLQNIFKRDARARIAYDKGRANALATVATTLIQKALNGNIAAMIFYLKSQGKWQEVHRTEISGPDGGAIETKELGEDPRELLTRRIAGIASRLTAEVGAVGANGGAVKPPTQ